MAKLPVKSESRNVQKQHVRRYRSSGRVTVVNKGNKKRSLPSRPTMVKNAKYGLGASPKQKNAFEEPKIRFQGKRRPEYDDPVKVKKEGDKFAELMAGMLLFRTVAYPGWESAYPPLVAEKVQTARLIQAMKDIDDFKEYATDEEALGYLSTMSLAGPLRTELAEIMVYLFNKVMPKDKIPRDLERVSPLSKSQMSDLRQLKRSIRKSQWKDLRERDKKRKEQEVSD